MVTIENWEEYAILKADGELDAAEAAALESFLAAHPELQEEAKLFESLKLVPDEEIVFSGKEALLKPEPKVIALSNRRMWAAAAGVALLLGAALLLRDGEEGITGASGSAVASAVKLETPKAPIQKSPIVTPSVSAPPRLVAEQNEPAPVVVRNRTAPKQQPIIIPQEAPQPVVKPENSDIAVLPQNESNTMPVEPVQLQPQTDPSANDVAPSEKRKESGKLRDRIALADDKLQLVDDLRTVASNRLQALRATRDKLRNTDVTVQLGRRDLFTIHF